MKTRSLIIAAVAAFAVYSCAPKVAETTVITGDLGADAPDQVHITIKDAGVDKAFPVKDGKFTAEIPTCNTAQARLTAGNVVGNFVADGTPLTITLNEDKSLNVVSKYPKISVQTRYNDYQKALSDIQAEYEPQLAVTANESARNKVMNAYQGAVKDLSLGVLDGNKDNIVTLAAIDNLQYLLDDDQIDSVLNVVDPAIKEVPAIKTMTTSIAARKATAEGAKFADFEVGDSKFSDYIGKGKYVLVDFWASWCGPCKAEVPNIKNVYEKYAGENFDVLGVAVWDKPDATAKAIKSLDLPWNQIVNAQSVPTDLYGIDGIPHIILFGPDGTILKRNLRGDAIEAEVAKYVQPVK